MFKAPEFVGKCTSKNCKKYGVYVRNPRNGIGICHHCSNPLRPNEFTPKSILWYKNIVEHDKKVKKGKNVSDG